MFRKIVVKLPDKKFNKNPLNSSRLVTRGQTGGQTHCEAKQEYELCFHFEHQALNIVTE